MKIVEWLNMFSTIYAVLFLFVVMIPLLIRKKITPESLSTLPIIVWAVLNIIWCICNTIQFIVTNEAMFKFWAIVNSLMFSLFVSLYFLREKQNLRFKELGFTGTSNTE